jgi:hypothetical protein
MTSMLLALVVGLALAPIAAADASFVFAQCEADACVLVAVSEAGSCVDASPEPDPGAGAGRIDVQTDATGPISVRESHTCDRAIAVAQAAIVSLAVALP